MLSLAEDPASAPEDWGILKDFLGFRLPHEREIEPEHVSQRHDTLYHHRSSHVIITDSKQPSLQHDIPSPPQVTLTPSHSLSSSLGQLQTVPLSIPSSNGPLPSITTLVRSSEALSRDCSDISESSIDAISVVQAPVDLSSIKTEYPTARQKYSSAFRSVQPPSTTATSCPIQESPPIGHSSLQPGIAQLQGEVEHGSSIVQPPTCEYDRTTQKATSASLLRDLLVLGKPTTRPSGPSEQGRLGGLVRSGSMEQRWQDLASLLSLPSPDHTHQSPPSMATSPVQHPQPNPIHHPHALYPPPHEGTSLGAASSPRGVLIHNVPMPDTHNITYANSMGASSHLVASSMNLANNSEIATSEHHHYKMETSGNMSQDMIYYQQSSGAEMNQSTDGFLSSILNDEDLQLMDIPMTDYNGRGGNGDYGASYRYPPPDDPHRLAPVAQKKHQMFGKRFVHDNNLHGTAPNNIPVVTPVGLPISSYPPHYVPAQTNIPMEGATAMDPSEMKYSCSMDFRTPETANAAVDHVQHNHTYHMSPEGSSGLSRHNARDRRKSDLEKSLSRDEKRARGSNLPITCEDIINLPMDEFNERISKYDLTEAQLSLIRDIRRRGKNKVAAQNCRKRKLDQIVHLAEEVKVIHYRKSELHSQLEHLTGEKSRIQQKFSRLYGHIFQSLRDAKGNPYSPHDFSLQQSADGNVLLVPRASPPPHHSDKSRHPKDDRGH